MARRTVVVPEIRVMLGPEEEDTLQALSRFGSWRPEKATASLRSLVRKKLVERRSDRSDWRHDRSDRSDRSDWRHDVCFSYRLTWWGRLVQERLEKLSDMTPLEMLADTYKESE
jgi:hypothetical protein